MNHHVEAGIESSLALNSVPVAGFLVVFEAEFHAPNSQVV